MSIVFACPSCRAELTISDAAAGKTGKCPHCKGPITVPALKPPMSQAVKPEPAALDVLPTDPAPSHPRDRRPRTEYDQQPSRKSKKGILLLVIGISAGLILVCCGGFVGIGTVAYMRTLEQEKKSVAKITIQHIADAVEIYKSEMGEYPPDLETLTQPMGSEPATLEEKDLTDPWNRPYVYEPQTRHPITGKPLIFSGGANGTERLSNR